MDRLLQFGHAGKSPAPYAFGHDLGKGPLAEIKPRRARRREVQLEARMLGEPRLHLGRLDCLFLSMREGLALD